MNELLDAYNFTDIDVYMKAGKDDYINISNFSVFSKKNERVKLAGFESQKKYALSFCNYISRKNNYACEVSIEELLTLAGIGDKSFISRFAGSDGDNEEVLALLCARKIVDYAYGKIICTKVHDETAYDFQRLSWKKTDGKRVREYPTILTKTFQKVIIE